MPPLPGSRWAGGSSRRGRAVGLIELSGSVITVCMYLPLYTTSDTSQTHKNVVPLEFGHFGKLNERYARTGIPLAKAGMMRRISIAVLKATTCHTQHGLESIVPQGMSTYAARRVWLAAAREADFDEHRAEVRSFGCDGATDMITATTTITVMSK